MRPLTFETFSLSVLPLSQSLSGLSPPCSLLPPSLSHSHLTSKGFVAPVRSSLSLSRVQSLLSIIEKNAFSPFSFARSNQLPLLSLSLSLSSCLSQGLIGVVLLCISSDDENVSFQSSPFARSTNNRLLAPTKTNLNEKKSSNFAAYVT